jgi:hypothetical protein
MHGEGHTKFLLCINLDEHVGKSDIKSNQEINNI